MKSIRRMWLSQMELVKKVENTPNSNWCTQYIKVFYKDGFIRIERRFSHPRYPDYSKTVNWYKGTREEAMAYSRMLRWD